MFRVSFHYLFQESDLIVLYDDEHLQAILEVILQHLSLSY